LIIWCEWNWLIIRRWSNFWSLFNSLCTLFVSINISVSYDLLKLTRMIIVVKSSAVYCSTVIANRVERTKLIK
jgi:hypothetical protein